MTSTRDCTCLGTCKGADGLAPGWRCALAGRRALTRLDRIDMRQRRRSRYRVDEYTDLGGES